MSKFKTMVKKDIELCDEYISKNMATHSEVNALLGKYVMDYPDFNKNIIAYASVPGYQTNEIENVKIIKSKLEYLLNRSDNPDLCNNQNNPGITISNVNNNNNTNSIKFQYENIEDIKANIEENTYLSDYDKEELLNKLEEIVELQKSKDSKSKKWVKQKKILAFLLDKGADIAIMYIPQILKAISNQENVMKKIKNLKYLMK